jgi:hypothetical protein
MHIPSDGDTLCPYMTLPLIKLFNFIHCRTDKELVETDDICLTSCFTGMVSTVGMRSLRLVGWDAVPASDIYIRTSPSQS